MLHIVNKSPFEKNSIQTCLRLSQAGSSIILIGNGVYAALNTSQISTQLQTHINQQTRNIYALSPDLNARGITADKLTQGIKTIDYADLVDLTVKCGKIQSWI